MIDAALPFVASSIQEGRTLIHCQAGLSRSASLAYMVLRCLGGLNDQEALRIIKTPDEPLFPHPEVLRSARAWFHRA
jgi:protein-tyrosine phosphatase